MRTLYFDCFNGATEAMLLASLLDAGADLEVLRRHLEPLAPGRVRVEAARVVERGVAATRVTVRATDDATRREMRQVARILLDSGLPRLVKARTLQVFHRLAVAQSRLQDLQPEEVVLGETGSLAAIATVALIVLALEQLGAERPHCSALPLGRGVVRGPLGLLPVPSPLVVALMDGIPVYDNGETGEQVTPLAVAVLGALCAEFGPMPSMRLAGQGWGIGSGKADPLCRVLMSTPEEGGAEPVCVLETNLEGAEPRMAELLADRLCTAGAEEVFLTPIVTKRGRPGLKLSAIALPDSQQAVTAAIFQETAAVGVRSYQTERSALEREIMAVPTDFGAIRVKVARQMGTVTHLMPEFQDCLQAARRGGVPLTSVWQATLSRALEQTGRAG